MVMLFLFNNFFIPVFKLPQESHHLAETKMMRTDDVKTTKMKSVSPEKHNVVVVFQ